MERRFSELWPKRVPPRPKDVSEPIYMATYTAVIDVEIVRTELRFNEALHPDEILRVLEIHKWGSDLLPEPTYSIGPWPPKGCTERNRFRLMALQKVSIFLLEARIRDDGFAFHDYHFNADPEGPPAPGLADDNATMIFVRSLAQGDLRRRIVALNAEG